MAIAAEKSRITITPTLEAVDMLDEMGRAYGLTRSNVCEMLIRRAYATDEVTTKLRNSRKRPKGR
jgi:hypothetical protein